MADAFKESLEKFLLYFIDKLGDQTDIDTIQSGYDSLINECIWKFHIYIIVLNYEFISKGEIDSIIESELGKTEKELAIVKEKNNELLKQVESLNTQLKIQIQQKEGLNQKLDILQKAIDEMSLIKNEKEKALIDLSNLQADNDRLQFKLNATKDEMEIYKKNLKRNFIMEKQIKSLTEENEKLSFTNKNLKSANDYKELCDKYEGEIQTLKETMGKIQQQIKEISNENIEIKKQRDLLNEKIVVLEKDNKVKQFQLEETIKQRDLFKNTNNELNNKIKEMEFNNKSNILVLGKQNKELKKEIQTLKQLHL